MPFQIAGCCECGTTLFTQIWQVLSMLSPVSVQTARPYKRSTTLFTQIWQVLSMLSPVSVQTARPYKRSTTLFTQERSLPCMRSQVYVQMTESSKCCAAFITRKRLVLTSTMYSHVDLQMIDFRERNATLFAHGQTVTVCVFAYSVDLNGCSC